MHNYTQTPEFTISRAHPEPARPEPEIVSANSTNPIHAKNRQNFKNANTSITPPPQPLSPPTFFSKPQLSRSNQLKWDLMHRVQFFSTQHLVFRSLYCALFVNISLRKLQLGWRNTCLSTLKLVASNNASNNVATDGQGPNLVRSQKTKKIGVR